jgi:hypothetical protein
MSHMRKVGAALLVMVAGAFFLLAWFALGTIGSEGQDNPDSTYITIAAVTAFSGLVFAALGVWVLRGR